MLGITIGTGDWGPVAEAAAARMQEMTGCLTTIIRNDDSRFAHPSWNKLFLNGPCFFFDADIWCMKRWNPQELLDRYQRTLMLPERPHTAIKTECQLYGIPLDSYYNAGLIIMTGNEGPLFENAFSRHPTYGRWLEQTSLNRSVVELKWQVQPLPDAYNRMVRIETPVEKLRMEQAINLHFAGPKTPAQLLEVYKQLG